MRRYRELIISILFLLASVGAYHQAQVLLSPDQTPSVAADTPVGLWEQYVLEGGRLVYLGSFEVLPDGTDYQVRGVEVSCFAYPQENLRAFDHVYDGQHWSYSSDWHEYGIARFELERVGPDRFEGWASVDGVRRPYRHVFFKVSPVDGE